ncbi:MAG: hypothetical protein ACK51F_11220 [Rhodospirillales bacterium]
MPEITKFLFETRFEAGAPAPPPPRKHFTAAEVEAARAAGLRDGQAAGRAKALAEIEARTAAAVESLAAGMGQTLAQIDARHGAQMREALDTAVETVRRLYPALAARHEITEIEALLAECVAQLPGEPRIAVRVPEALAPQIGPRIERAAQRTGFQGQIAIVGDPTLADNQSRIEWSDGGVTRDPSLVWTEIESIVARYGAAEPGAQEA